MKILLSFIPSRLFLIACVFFVGFGKPVKLKAQSLPKAEEKKNSSMILPPFPLQGNFEHLPVPGYLPAAVGIPNGKEPKPVLVALHGSFDQPEWHLETWYPMFQNQAFLLCTRGMKRWDSPKEPHFLRYVYRDIEPELMKSIRSLKERFGSQVSSDSMMYLGFSQGAILGVPILVKHAAQFPKAILIEGGTRWTKDMALSYAKHGGKKILFACGQEGCYKRALASAETLQKAGISTKVVYAPLMGHTYADEVAEKIKEEISWFLQ